jgi:2,3-dimethylmalate lyase
MNRTTRFKQLIEAPAILSLPGVHDPLTARIAEQVGFEAITCGGYSATAALLGQPDTSVLSMTELADHYARICDAVDIPVFGDGDTGFGNMTNTVRTVRQFERSGLAGMFIEDQVFPKRCGHMAGKDVVPVEIIVAKLKAALDARVDADFVIMARTDANAVLGIDEAIERACLFRELGADLIFVEAPTNVAEMRRICNEIDGPCLANNVEGGQSPILPGAELAEIGYAVFTHPVAMSHAIARTAFALYETLKRDGTTAAVGDAIMGFEEFHGVVGLPALRRQEQACQDFAETFLEEKSPAQ